MFPMPFFLISLLYFNVSTHPEVHIQVSTSSKFPVADLEGDGHPVVGMQHFVEALARVSPQLHVVCKSEHNAGQQHQQGVEGRRHVCGIAADRWLGVVVVKSNATLEAWELKVAFLPALQEGSPRCFLRRKLGQDLRTYIYPFASLRFHQ